MQDYLSYLTLVWEYKDNVQSVEITISSSPVKYSQCGRQSDTKENAT